MEINEGFSEIARALNVSRARSVLMEMVSFDELGPHLDVGGVGGLMECCPADTRAC